ncbi:hypothetical protein QFC22_002992 [Naganishia vaughanmartiniae]|uniref:Uncharacterized protein n=1 Tax=Naganishia vaughanmartiniae TaxID=1424756 RepID=A0ACC2X9K4_9TREE|nr:hypothetical protein QFC22_002992 [Naganishia vaughanmartiniae]
MATSGNFTTSGASVNQEDGQDMPIQQSPSAGGASARNISAQEIQREMATLRSASSVGPGALSFDPDLPPPAASVAHSTSPPKGNPYMHQHQHYRLHDDNIQPNREYSAQSPTSPVSPSRSAATSAQYSQVPSKSPYVLDSTYQLPAIEYDPFQNDHESDFDRFPQSYELDPDKPIMAQGEARLAGILPSAPSDDPRHLYWVPAHLHPELAPTEFRAFMKEHAHGDPSNATGDASAVARSPSWLARAGANGTGMVADLARRSSSVRDGTTRLPQSTLGPMNSATSTQGVPSLGAASSLSRKRSMLSRQYHPRQNDDVENEPPPLPLHRQGSLSRSLTRSRSIRGSSVYGGATADQGVTLEDLQKLESIADEAAESGDPEVMRTLLKRSLTLNFSNDCECSSPITSRDELSLIVDSTYVVVEGHPEVAQMISEQDSPTLLTPTGSIMRRNAGTRRERGSGITSRLASSRRSKGRDALSGASADIAEPASPLDSQMTPFQASTDQRTSASPASLAPPPDASTDPRRRRSVDSDSDEMYSAESGSVSEATGVLPSDDRRPSSASTEDSSIYDAYATSDSQADTSVESSVSSTSYSGVDSISEDYHGREHKTDDFLFEKSLHGLIPAYNVSADRDNQVYGTEHGDGGDRTPTSQISEDAARSRIVGERNEQQQSQRQVYDAPRSTVTPPSPPETIRSQLHAASEKPATIAQYQQPPKQPVVQELTVSTKQPVKVDLAPPPSKLLKTKQSTEKLKVKSEKRGGLFSKNKDKDKSKQSDKKEEKGFLGSLFGSKKKHEDTAPSKFSQEGKATAAALLGTSKSAKSLGLIPMRGPSPTSPGFAPYARYPIHVERAVYRLSHIKLANPRRPLYEQVLISNLMFWYLSIINKPVMPSSPQSPQHKDTPVMQSSAEGEKASATTTRPSAVRNATPSAPQPAIKTPTPAAALEAGAKRTSLSKPEQRGGQIRPRSAETPVRSPQYGMQNLQMQQEYTTRPPQRSSSSQQLAPEPNPAPQLSQTAAPAVRRQPLPNPINTNVPPVIQQPPQRNPQPVYESNPQHHSPVEKPRRPSQPANALPVMENGRRPLPDRVQQQGDRPYGAPYHGPPAQYQSQPERRESPRPRQAYPSHSGPQPGQVFQYPSAMLNIKPGQVFPSGGRSPVGTQPGQVFQHPQYTHNAQYVPQLFEQPAARLPPGAINPRQSSQDQGWNAAGPHLGPPISAASKGSNVYDQASGRRATSGGEPYYNEYSNPPQQTSPRSVSASAVVPHDPRVQQTRLGVSGAPMRTPSPQPPNQNHEQNYAFRQPIPGHYEPRR